MSEIERRRGRVEAGLLPERILDTDDWRPVSIDERRRRLGIAGLSVAVIDGGQIVWAAGYGFADEPERRPVTTDTLFLAGSISKMVNALAVMRLVEAGALDLDADVNERLRSWRVPANGAWQPVVTLRQLLSHTAGLTTHGFPGYAAGIPVPSVPALLDGEGNTPPVRVNLLPGLHFRYSGGGTTVVQQLLVDVTGESYPELLRRLVLEPAGMRDSTFEQPLPQRLHERAASGHHLYGSRIAGRWHVYPEMAAAGLWTTPSDLGRFAIELQRALRGESRLIARRTAELMLTPHPEPGAGFGLGPGLGDEGGEPQFGHGGSDEGFTALLWAYRDRDVGGAVMSNAHTGRQLISEVFNAIAREYGWPGWMPDPVRPSGAVDLAHAGEYELRPGVRVAVEASDGGLSFRLTGQPAMPMIPTGDGYHLSAVNATVHFEDDRLVLTQAGQRLEARRSASG